MEPGAAPLLFPYEEIESPRREWTTVGQKVEKKSFRQFEKEEHERIAARRKEQAEALERRKAGRPPTPPAGDVPGVPGRLVAKKPIAQANKYSALE
jgi:hypothetical protein